MYILFKTICFALLWWLFFTKRNRRYLKELAWPWDSCAVSPALPWGRAGWGGRGSSCTQSCQQSLLAWSSRGCSALCWSTSQPSSWRIAGSCSLSGSAVQAPVTSKSLWNTCGMQVYWPILLVGSWQSF